MDLHDNYWARCLECCMVCNGTKVKSWKSFWWDWEDDVTDCTPHVACAARVRDMCFPASYQEIALVGIERPAYATKRVGYEAPSAFVRLSVLLPHICHSRFLSRLNPAFSLATFILWEWNNILCITIFLFFHFIMSSRKTCKNSTKTFTRGSDVHGNTSKF